MLKVYKNPVTLWYALLVLGFEPNYHSGSFFGWGVEVNIYQQSESNLGRLVEKHKGRCVVIILKSRSY